ncbi:MAG: peptidoglycan DD-metalloendopeptidase family protein [Ignavibacteriales bacterium]|nr:peptidoglycan DD-metalloendopeptidase family protein [Ignavibacteriales bacterium]
MIAFARSLAAILLLVALSFLVCEPAMGQSGSKQPSRKSKSTQKARTEKDKRPASVSDMQKEQARLRAEAAAAEKEFNKKVDQEKSTLANINKLEQQINSKRKSIRRLQEQEEQLTGEIRSASSSIGNMEQQLESLKGQYARYVQSVYKHGRVYDLELLFSSNSVNQLSIRIEYLKRFSEQRAKDLRNVVTKKNDLEHQNQRLEASLKEQHRLLARRTDEESSLKGDVSRRQKMLASIRKDKTFYREQADEKRAAADKLKNIITDLINKETERKEREAAAERERSKAGSTLRPTPVPDAGIPGTFAAQHGRLRWPVSLGSIAARFGNQVHPVLKTVRENTGIDISVRPGSEVRAVADGRVSIVTFIPGLGNIVILTHSDGYRTIYADLSEVNVAENQKIAAGETIAKSGSSVDGDILHFEIWKDREKQNPELWLAKQR